MFERCSILARSAVMIARMEAGRAGADSVDTEHLLIGILSVHPELGEQLGIEVNSIRKRSERWHLPSTPIPTTTDVPITADLGRVFERASLSADERQCREIRTEHLLLSMLEIDSGVTQEKLLVLMAAVDCNGAQLVTDAADAAVGSIFEGGVIGRD